MNASNLMGATFVILAGALAWIGANSSVQSPGDARSTPVTITDPPAVGMVAEAPVPETLSPGYLPTRVVIASANIDAAISEVGVVLREGRPDWETAWRAAGHHLDSARPGQPGNMVLSGHVSVADKRNLAVFRDLDRIQVGDEIDVYAGESMFRYQAQEARVVDPDAVSVLSSDHRSLVTLITCTKDLRRRLIVVGELRT